jgi:hypothetical protein
MSASHPKADKSEDISLSPLSANSVINAVQQTVFTAFHPDEILVLVRAFYRGL